MKKINQNFTLGCLFGLSVLFISFTERSAPKIVTPLKAEKSYYIEGESASYETEIASSAQYNCYFNKWSVLLHPRYIIKCDGIRFKLKVNQLNLDDNGKITFEFINEWGEATTSIKQYVFSM